MNHAYRRGVPRPMVRSSLSRVTCPPSAAVCPLLPHPMRIATLSRLNVPRPIIRTDTRPAKPFSSTPADDGPGKALPPELMKNIGTLSQDQRHELVKAIVALEMQSPTASTAASSTSPDSAFFLADINKDGVLSKFEFDLYMERYKERHGSGSQGTTHAGESADDSRPPSSSQLRTLALQTALPMIGFGFCDNSLMILAGDVIEENLGAYMKLSTMASAGLGNMFADVAGIGLSGVIAAFVARRFMNSDPQLSRSQQRSQSALWVRRLSGGFGIAFGCLLGMSPLLFISA